MTVLNHYVRAGEEVTIADLLPQLK